MYKAMTCSENELKISDNFRDNMKHY